MLDPRDSSSIATSDVLDAASRRPNMVTMMQGAARESSQHAGMHSVAIGAHHTPTQRPGIMGQKRKDAPNGGLSSTNKLKHGRPNDAERGLPIQAAALCHGAKNGDTNIQSVVPCETVHVDSVQPHEAGSHSDSTPAWSITLTNANSDDIDFTIVDQAVIEWNADPNMLRLTDAKSDVDEEETRHRWMAQYETFVTLLVQYLNRFWTVVTDYAKPIFIRRVVKPSIQGEMEVEHVKQGLNGFRECMQNRAIFIMDRPLKKHHILLADLWLRSPHRNTKHKVIFYPGGLPNSRDFNLWRGFAITRQQAEAYTLQHPGQYAEQVHRFVHHITHIWCQDDDDAAAYCLNWFASVLQHPERKLQVALLVQGDHGADKGVVAMLLRAIIGRVHFTHFTNLSDALNRFNGTSLESCVLGLVDEVTLGSTHNGERDAQSSALKALITASRISSYLQSGSTPISISCATPTNHICYMSKQVSDVTSLCKSMGNMQVHVQMRRNNISIHCAQYLLHSSPTSCIRGT